MPSPQLALPRYFFQMNEGCASFLYLLKCLEERGPVRESDAVPLTGCAFLGKFLTFFGLRFLVFDTAFVKVT